MGSLFLVLVVALGLGGVAPGTDLKNVHDPVEVVRCDSLTVYYPRFRRMDLATGSMPQKSDSTVIFCCAAAFTGEKLTTFKHSNIAGHHVSGGTFYEGFHCGPNNGVFTWTPTGGWNYFNFSHKNSRPPLKKAAEQGGMGFCQSLLFHNGQGLLQGRPREPLPGPLRDRRTALYCRLRPESAVRILPRRPS